MTATADLTTDLMPFPDSPRVIYATNPLEEVICQLKFPPILRIDSELPAGFQDRLRQDYPVLLENLGIQQLNLPPQIAKLIGNDFPGIPGGRVYQFASTDGIWKVGLSRDFVALSTLRYARWEEFKSRLNALVIALVDQYRPAFLARIGLRYRDVIRRSQFGLSEAPWTDLLATHILGELADANVAPSIQLTTRNTLFALPEAEGRVRMIHGLVQFTGSVEKCYSIDSDFFTEQRAEVGNVFDILNVFNRQAGKLFRWCITKQLHEALGPQRLD
jgi:uncharacterized protein (TIGR04255 family)